MCVYVHEKMRFNHTEDENGRGIVADEIACDLRLMAKNA